jgi:signal-transduction protein with cAMP-binding, CBS, and nucleotidyltransferase domain
VMSNAGEINTRSFLTMQVSNILHPNVAILDQFQTTSDAIKLMKDRSVRSVLVTDTKKEVIGLVSKTDILYRVLALRKSPARVTLEEIMTTPIISIPPSMSVADALSVMEKHVIRQVAVSSGNKVYGLISRDDIIVKMEKALVTVNAFKVESPLCIMSPFASTSLTEKKSTLICPHCNDEFHDKELLANHVKAIHPISTGDIESNSSTDKT